MSTATGRKDGPAAPQRARATASRVVTGRFGRRGSVGPEHDARALSDAIARAKEGDREAMQFLYLRYWDSVYGYVKSLVRDEHEAEDVTQQVFIKLMTRLHQYHEQETPFLGWILRVARNATIDQMRQRRAIPSSNMEGSDTRTCDIDSHSAWSLRTALAALPGSQREVVVLRHVVGMSPGEIAERLGRTEAAVHGLHNRGRAALRAELMQLGSAPVTALAA